MTLTTAAITFVPVFTLLTFMDSAGLYISSILSQTTPTLHQSPAHTPLALPHACFFTNCIYCTAKGPSPIFHAPIHGSLSLALLTNPMSTLAALVFTARECDGNTAPTTCKAVQPAYYQKDHEITSISSQY
jgi:hypothetical protein